MHRLRIFTAVVLALAVIPVIGARQQQPTFKTGVEVVLIDVNVVDRSHTPVNDLRPEDFIVEVDYKARKVVSAQFVRYDVKTTTTTERRTAPALAPIIAAEGSAVPAPARNVLIVVDNDSMEPGDGLLVRKEAARFIDRLAPDDRVGVVTIPRMQSEVTMTKNREQVKTALNKVITGSERYRSMEYRIGLAEAFAAERDSSVLQSIVARECPKRDPICPREVVDAVKQVQLQNHLRGERSLQALRDLGLALSKVNGPKTMVVVSGGAPSPDLKSSTWYSLVAQAFASAQISLYTLLVDQPEFGQVKYQTSPTAAQDYLVEREGVENATSASGGTFMEAIGTWDQYFDRIATELSGSYLLGIEVEASDRNGRPHQVSVKVNRKDVEVRARKQYVIEPAK